MPRLASDWHVTPWEPQSRVSSEYISSARLQARGASNFSPPMAPRTQTSAAGVLSLLSESDPFLQQYALEQLNILVPQFWAEISESITAIEAIYDNTSLSKKTRDLAALITSKVYYYLAEYDEALSFALGAGSLFDLERRNSGSEEYVETVISKAIDRYIQLRASEEAGEPTAKIDPRLSSIIEGIFRHCLDEGEHKQVSISFLHFTPPVSYLSLILVEGSWDCARERTTRHNKPGIRADQGYGNTLIRDGSSA